MEGQGHKGVVLPALPSRKLNAYLNSWTRSLIFPCPKHTPTPHPLPPQRHNDHTADPRLGHTCPSPHTCAHLCTDPRPPHTHLHTCLRFDRHSPPTFLPAHTNLPAHDPPGTHSLALPPPRGPALQPPFPRAPAGAPCPGSPPPSALTRAAQRRPLPSRRPCGLGPPAARRPLPAAALRLVRLRRRRRRRFPSRGAAAGRREGGSALVPAPHDRRDVPRLLETTLLAQRPVELPS